TDDLFHAMEARSQLRHRPTHEKPSPGGRRLTTYFPPRNRYSQSALAFADVARRGACIHFCRGHHDAITLEEGRTRRHSHRASGDCRSGGILAIAPVLHRAGRKSVPTQPRPSGSIIEIPAHPAHAGRPQRAEAGWRSCNFHRRFAHPNPRSSYTGTLMSRTAIFLTTAFLLGALLAPAPAPAQSTQDPQ